MRKKTTHGFRPSQEHKLNCGWCSEPIEMNDFIHFFRNENRMRCTTRCRSCLMNNIVQKNKLGYFSMYKSDYARYARNVVNKTNRITPILNKN